FTVISIIRLCTANSVTQSKPAVTVEARQFTTLDCEYRTTDTTPYVFWYVQHPGRGLWYIVRSLGRSEEVTAVPKFSGLHDTKKKYFL
ncbi:hypothetical protein GDO81_001861, partial [Engystomops pustulosus]